MRMTLLDTQTNITKTFETRHRPWYWAEGNGSCDCNRASIMGCTTEMDAIMRDAHPELESWQSICYGRKRFLIIAADCVEYTLMELNENYPPEPMRKYLK